MTTKADLAEIKRGVELFLQPGAVVEMRAPKTPYKPGSTATFTVSGYFDDIAACVKAAAAYDGQTPGLYLTMNPVNPDLLARAANRSKKAEATTGDSDIVRRWWFLIDCDPTRAPGISATDEEKQAAEDTAASVCGYLSAQGWPQPVWADSGNGMHLLFRIDLPNDDASTAILQGVLAYLKSRFNTPAVSIDDKVFNASRICKLYGTMACKGDSTATRPHRRSRILSVPDVLQVVTIEQLRLLSVSTPAPTKPTETTGASSYDVEAFMARHGIEVGKSFAWKDGGWKWELAACPFCEVEGKAYIARQPSGAILAGCVRDKCTWRWPDLRAKFEPKAEPVPAPDAPVRKPVLLSPVPDGMAESLVDVIRNYVILVGSDQAWDRRRRRIIGLGAVRVAHGDVYAAWLKDERRQRADIEDLVFEPAGAEPHQINQFRGLPLTPDGKKPHARLVEHISWLCNGDLGLAHWVTCWLAYPLQHIGAKLQTALVFHGAQGTGKNLLFNTVRAIYGEYGREIGQTDLESPYTGWAAAKLFLVANEVISSSERAHTKNRIKNLITDPTLTINEKFQAGRQESNHCNLVFLSNEDLPVVPDADDRRFTVIYAGPDRVREQAYYDAIADEVHSDGAAGLYHYLLNYPLNGWGAHSKPYETDAKQALKDLCRTSGDIFLDAWSEEEIPGLFYGSCTTADLYLAYRAHCSMTGETAESLTAFGKRLSRRFGDRKRREHINGIGHVAVVMPENAIRFDQVQSFREAANEYAANAKRAKL